MERKAKHWIDPTLRAVNVREVSISSDILAALAPLVPELQAIDPAARSVQLSSGLDLAVTRPKHWASDIAWISQATVQGFAFFDSLFAQLGLADAMAPHIACDVAPVLYSGFFVTRSRSDGPSYHHDWIDGDNQGFTLIAPLSANCAELGLIYADIRGEERRYAYQPGKGVVFGDRFLHSTALGQTAEPTVLLSLTFGTDRMDRWDRLSATAGQQGMLHRRPDGVFVRDGQVI